MIEARNSNMRHRPVGIGIQGLADAYIMMRYPFESTFEGSPVSKGILQYDMWGVTPTNLHDWAALKAKIAKHGVRNSLLMAPMPTASSAQILGNNESVGAYTSNINTRRVLSGEFQVVNQHPSATSRSSASGLMTSRMTSSPLTEVSSTSPPSRTTSRSFTRLSGRSLRRMSSSRPLTEEPSLISPSH